MPRQLCLILCANCRREVLALQSAPEFRNIRSRRCRWTATKSRPDGMAWLKPPAPAGRRLLGLLIGSYCLARASKARPGRRRPVLAERPMLRVGRRQDLLDRFLQDGALCVLPGWLRDWRPMSRRAGPPTGRPPGFFPRGRQKGSSSTRASIPRSNMNSSPSPSSFGSPMKSIRPGSATSS